MSTDWMSTEGGELERGVDEKDDVDGMSPQGSKLPFFPMEEEGDQGPRAPLPPASHPLHKAAPLPANEAQRLEVLRSLSLLDTEEEDAFNRITQAASATLKFPTCLVSLVDKERQWFKSVVGLGVRETHRDLAFCSHVVHKDGNDCMVVSDTWQDDRFKYSDLVLDDPKIRAYAGAPLLYQRDGKTYKLGTLCVIDSTPRDVTSDQVSLLETMAKLVVAEIEVREKKMKDSRKAAHIQVQLFPRRKVGDTVFPEKGRLPVKIDRKTIESLFGMPQPNAARKLGISLTSLKQVCRKLGVTRWPCQRQSNGGSATTSDLSQEVAVAQGAAGGAATRLGAPAQGPEAAASEVPAPPHMPQSWHVQPTTGRLSVKAHSLEVTWLDGPLSKVLEASPFPVVGQRLTHMLHPRCARRLEAALPDLIARAHRRRGTEMTQVQGFDEEGFDEDSVQCQLMVYGRIGTQVLAEGVQCRLQLCPMADVQQQQLTLELELEHVGSPKADSPVSPMGMNGTEMQMLLEKAGQFVIDDLASETDYSVVSARSSLASGLHDLWRQWEERIRALAEQASPLPGSGSLPAVDSPQERQHPALECLDLLKQLDRRAGMRVIQNSTRLLMVPELHGNVVALSCHVRFAVPYDEMQVDNPLGPIAAWNPSEGLLLGMAGAPLMCDGRLQYHQAMGHFVPTAYWDRGSRSLHVHLQRMLMVKGRLTVYQTEHCTISRQEGRNVILVQGLVAGAVSDGAVGAAGAAQLQGQSSQAQAGAISGRPAGDQPFHYRLVLAQLD